MKLKRILPFAKELLSNAISPGDIVIDGTAGNGHDTLFLAELVGDTGKVYAFDIQEQAIQATAERVGQAGIGSRVVLINDGHENVKEYVNEEITGAIFNLGYLPGSDHKIVTKGLSTIEAITNILSLLKVGGLVVLVVYHGHEGGKQEKDELLSYVQQLPHSYVHVLSYQFLNQVNDPPFIIALEKMKAN